MCLQPKDFELREGARPGTRIAPGVAGAVVGADASEARDTKLDEDPVEGEVSETVFNHDSRASGTGAVDVKPVAAEIDKPARRPWLGRGRGADQADSARENRASEPGSRCPVL
jgi:hypothetical protein